MSVMVIIWSTLSSMFHSFYLMEFKHWSFSYHLAMQRHCCYFLNPNAANNFNNFGCVCISDYPVYYLFQGFHISMHAHWIGHWPTIEVKSIRSNLAVNYLFIEFNEVIIFIYLFVDCCSLFFGQTKAVILVDFGELLNAIFVLCTQAYALRKWQKFHRFEIEIFI